MSQIPDFRVYPNPIAGNNIYTQMADTSPSNIHFWCYLRIVYMFGGLILGDGGVKIDECPIVYE